MKNKPVLIFWGVLAVFLTALGILSILYGHPLFVLRTIIFQDSGVYDYRIFPGRQLKPSSTPFHFTENIQKKRISSIFENILGVENWDEYLEENRTQAFLVIQDDTILYENYFLGADRETLVTSFSIAKSITSALVGKAIEQGLIKDVSDSIVKYLPELADRDIRLNQVTLRNLLMMTAGLSFVKTGFLDGDETKAYYHPDLRKTAIREAVAIENPGEVFLYNHYSPQLLGMILERTTGKHVTDYLQAVLWDPLGMEYGGTWSLDSRRSGFEKMKAGINGRVIDFAKLGRLYLNEGMWEEKQMIPVEWVKESTSPDWEAMKEVQYPRWFSSGPRPLYYGYMWWGYLREDGTYDFYAEGDKGQFLYISPGRKLIIVRHGETYGAGDWNSLFFRFCTDF